MSLFWIGGKPEKVSPDRLLPEMFEDRYFLPDTIHGDSDYVIRVYLNDAHSESPEYKDHDQFEAEYIDKDLILKAYRNDPTCGTVFSDILAEELESFGIPNDGGHDFNEIFNTQLKLDNADIMRLSEATVEDLKRHLDNLQRERGRHQFELYQKYEAEIRA